MANHAHPPQGKRLNALSMSRGHGIISTDIIPALICRPTRGRTISLANHAHPSEGKRLNALSMSRGHGIMSPDIIPALICHPTRGRIISLANHAHPPEGKRLNALSMSRGHGIMSTKQIKRKGKDFPFLFMLRRVIFPMKITLLDNIVTKCLVPYKWRLINGGTK